MTNMKPTDVITGLRNTRRSLGDGTLNGRSRVATPAQTGSARKIPKSRVSPAGSVIARGETITLSGTTQDGSGALEWSAQVSDKIPAGFSSLSLPTTDIPTSVKGYYDVQDLVLELASATGATITVYAVDSGGSTRELGTYTGPSSWKHLDQHHFSLGVLDEESIRIVVDQSVTGTFYGNFSAIERQRTVMATSAVTYIDEFGETFAGSSDATYNLAIPGDLGVSNGDLLLVTIGTSGFNGATAEMPDGTLVSEGTVGGQRHSLWWFVVDSALLSGGIDYTIHGLTNDNHLISAFVVRGASSVVNSQRSTGSGDRTVALAGANLLVAMVVCTDSSSGYPTVSPSRTLLGQNPATATQLQDKARLWETDGTEDVVSSSGSYKTAWHVEVS